MIWVMSAGPWPVDLRCSSHKAIPRKRPSTRRPRAFAAPVKHSEKPDLPETRRTKSKALLRASNIPGVRPRAEGAAPPWTDPAGHGTLDHGPPIRWSQTEPALRLVHALDVATHFFRFLAGLAQTVHRSRQFCLRLGQLVGQVGFPLLEVGDCLVAGFLGLVEFLAHTLQLVHISLADAFETMDHPMGKPAKCKGHEKDDRGRHDEFASIHRQSPRPVARCPHPDPAFRDLPRPLRPDPNRQGLPLLR